MRRTPASREPQVDAAIAGCLRDGASPSSLRSLVSLGSEALTRWIEVFHGRGSQFARPQDLDLPGRAEADIWWIMLGALAEAYPGPFLDAVEAGSLALDRDDTALVVALGLIDEPRAVSMLIEAVSSPDWLSRLHAVQGLAGRGGENVRAALRRAAADGNDQVRVAASRALRRRRPRFPSTRDRA
jgi:hypothetical protein